MKPSIKTTVLRTLTLAVISAAGIHAAQAAESNYISVFGGLNSLDDTSISSSTGAINSDFDEGFGVGVAIGRWFDSRQHWRGEVELSYRENDIDRLGTAGGGGEVNSLAYMVNGYYDFRPNARVQPYVGAGVGIAEVEAENIAFGGARLDDDDSVFAYQFIGGVGYQLTDTVDLFGELRYLATDDPEFNGGQELDHESANALAGLRYRF